MEKQCEHDVKQGRATQLRHERLHMELRVERGPVRKPTASQMVVMPVAELVCIKKGVHYG
jgi:hypothetical protein